MHIVLTDAATLGNDARQLERFEAFGRVTAYDLTAPQQIAERIADADVILCNKTVLGAEQMRLAPKLKYIGLFATGYNNIDIEYACAHGITVCNVPDYSTDAVAQHTFALLLALTDRVHEYNATVAQGDWVRSRTFSYFPIPLAELCGKTIGIVGYVLSCCYR